MDYVLFAAWCFLVALGGGLVGLVLGNIRLPAVLLLSSSPAAGTGANIGISAVAAGPRPSLTSVPVGSTGGCSAGWRHRRSWARWSAATSRA